MDFIFHLDNNIIPNISFLSELDRAVLSNDKDKVIYLLTNGHTLFNLKDSKLCNNILNKNIKNHTCISFVCFKTSLYYAFVYNFILVIKIYKILNILNNKININTDCLCHNLYVVKSAIIDFNFLNYIDNLNIITSNKQLINQYESFLLTNKNYDKINLLNSKEHIYCFHNNLDINSNDRSIMAKRLINYFYNYNLSNEIIKLLYNQQLFELVKTNNFAIIDQIYNSQIIDLTQKNYSNKLVIYDYILNNINNYDLLAKIYNLSSEIYFESPNNILVKNLIDKKFYDNLFFIIENYDLSSWDENYFIIPIINSNIPNKQKLINKLYERHLIIVNQYVLYNLLNYEKSDIILAQLSLGENFYKSCDYDLVKKAIKFNKHNELNIILRELKIKNPNYFKDTIDNQLLKLYFSFNSENIEILDVIINFISDINFESPLLLSVEQNKLEVSKFLFLHGANPFVRNNKNYNCLHISILNNNFELFSLFIDSVYNGNVLMYETFDNLNIFDFFILNKPENNWQDYINHLFNNTFFDVNKYYNSRIIEYIILNINLSNNDKKEIINLLIQNNNRFIEIYDIYEKPVILDAVENNLYGVVLILLNFLLKNKYITIDKINDQNYYSRIFKYIQDGTLEIKKIKHLDKPNFFKLVSNYLLNNKIYLVDNLELAIGDDTNDIKPQVLFKLKQINAPNILFKSVFNYRQFYIKVYIIIIINLINFLIKKTAK